jgi:DNA-binding CsgD family transcriptional regulator
MTSSDDRIGPDSDDPQLAESDQFAGNTNAALDYRQRGQAVLGDFSPGGGERWITSQLQLISGFALYQRPGLDADCAVAIRCALRAKHDLGDEVGMAYCLEVLGWLASRGAGFDQAACLLGAADSLWRRTGNRLSSIVILERIRQRATDRAREALGDAGYETAYARGGALELDIVVARAVDERAVDEPGPATRLSARPAAVAVTDGGGHRDGGPAAAVPARTTALTRREREIAVLVASGLSNREIGARLFISKRTVDAHVEHIFAKLEISSRIKLTLWLRSQVQTGG